MYGRIGAYESWSQTDDPKARTKPARDAFLARFEAEVDPDGVLPEKERKQRAVLARRAYMLRLSAKSAAARRQTRVAHQAARPAGGYECIWCKTWFPEGSYGWTHRAPLEEGDLCPGCNYGTGLDCFDCGSARNCNECVVDRGILEATGRPGFKPSWVTPGRQD